MGVAGLRRTASALVLGLVSLVVCVVAMTRADSASGAEVDGPSTRA